MIMFSDLFHVSILFYKNGQRILYYLEQYNRYSK